MRRATYLAHAALAAVVKADWDESQHPRDEQGQFSGQGGQGEQRRHLASNSGQFTRSGKAIISADKHLIHWPAKKGDVTSNPEVFALHEGRRRSFQNGERLDKFTKEDHDDAAAFYRSVGDGMAAKAHEKASAYLSREGAAGPSKYVKGLSLSRPLAQSELSAIRQYVHSDHNDGVGQNDAINSHLRGVPRESAGIFHELSHKDAEKHGASLQSAINASQTTTDVTLFRGIANGKSISSLSAGTVFQMKGITSTSPKESSAKFYTRGSRDAVVLKIVVPKGGAALSVDEHSQHPTEREVLLPHDSSYRVEKIEYGRGAPTVHLTQLLGSAVSKAAWDESQRGRAATTTAPRQSAVTPTEESRFK